jgi:hypothetical protein
MTTTAEAFTAYINTLTPEELGALGVSVMTALGEICIADDQVSFFELIAIGRGSFEGLETLGDGFSQMIDLGKDQIDQSEINARRKAIRARNKGAEAAEGGGSTEGATVTENILERLQPQQALARGVIERMPAAAREPFEDVFSRWVLHVAEASGGFLWWGEKISPAERDAARKVFSTLGIVVRDPAIRKKFAIES